MTDMQCTHACSARRAELEAKIAELEAKIAKIEGESQAIRDRLEFVEPMYLTVRHTAEGTWAANVDIRTRLRGAEAKMAEMAEEMDMYRGAAAEASGLRRQLDGERAERAKLDAEFRALTAVLRFDPNTNRVIYRAGPNRPPSARRKAEAAEAAKKGDEPKGGGGGGRGRRRQPARMRGAAPGRPGGRPGGKGHGRSCRPTRTRRHRLPRNGDGSLALAPCRCGRGHWKLVDNDGRVILEVRLVVENVKDVTERAMCTGCGAIRPAVNGLPRRGTWSRETCGVVAAMRAENMTYDGIARLITDAAPKGIKVPKSTVIEGLKRVSDAARPVSKGLLAEVNKAEVAYEDESESPALPTRLTAERSEALGLAESIGISLIGAVPAGGLPAVLAVDPWASSWAAGAAAGAMAGAGGFEELCGLGSPGPPPPAALPARPLSETCGGGGGGGGGGVAGALARAEAVAGAELDGLRRRRRRLGLCVPDPQPSALCSGVSGASGMAGAMAAGGPAVLAEAVARAELDGQWRRLGLAVPDPQPSALCSGGAGGGGGWADAGDQGAPAGAKEGAAAAALCRMVGALEEGDGEEAAAAAAADWPKGRPRKGRRSADEDAAAGLSMAALIDAAARTAAGIGPDEGKVGAEAEECRRDGSANGIGWVWVFTSGPHIAYRIGLTRAGMMHDMHMAAFRGILVADRYTVYRSRFEALGRLQLCWAHEMRHLAEIALRPGSSMEARRMYHEVGRLFAASRDAAKGSMPRTAAARSVFDSEMDRLLDAHRGSEKEEDVEAIVAMLDRDKGSLFTFVEHDGVEPTNNRAERALRYIVLWRKIFGQIKGGRRGMERWADLASCLASWRAQGKSIIEEVARIV